MKVFGEVSRQPFALKPGANVIDILMRAGGVTRFASVEQIRILNRNRPVVFNLQSYLDSGDRAFSRARAGLDDLRAQAAGGNPPRRADCVCDGRGRASPARLKARRARPSSTFSPIRAGRPALPTRGRSASFAPTATIVHVDLPMFTEGGGAAAASIPATRSSCPRRPIERALVAQGAAERAVQVLGAVVKPGRYEWSDEMSLFDLIAAAGGPRARANLAHPDPEERGFAPSRPSSSTWTLSSNGGSCFATCRASARATVMVPELPIDPTDNKAQWTRQAPENSIYVMGQVAMPGRYAFNHKLGFLDIITAANGPTRSGRPAQHPRLQARAAGRAGHHVNLEPLFPDGR